ncbi:MULTISPECIES: hypothetical protein [Calothrix]|nr:hypothetical protein [Calothrix anomala]
MSRYINNVSRYINNANEATCVYSIAFKGKILNPIFRTQNCHTQKTG